MNYDSIKDHYEQCLAANPDDPFKAVDWEDRQKAFARYENILSLIKPSKARMMGLMGSASCSTWGPATLLDFGCGNGMLWAYSENVYDGQLINSNPIDYTGLDISQAFIDKAKSFSENIVESGNSIYGFQRKVPKFICKDILKEEWDLGEFDYIAANGTFTEKRDLHWANMIDFMMSCLKILWKHTNKGLIFNVMDWNMIHPDNQREELFFLSYDQIFNVVIDELKPARWVIENIGLNDVHVKMWKQ